MSEGRFIYDTNTKSLIIEFADKDSYGLFCDHTDCENLIFKEGIKELPESSLVEFHNIEELIFPDSLETLQCYSIPSGANSKNKRVHFGKGLKNIAYKNPNYYAFEYIPHCSALNSLKDIESVTIDPDNPYFKIENDMFFSKDGSILYAYIGKGCDELVIPDNVTEIKGHAFFHNSKINKLVIPGSVKKIEPAFVYSKIGELILSEGVEEIANSAFLRSEIETIHFPKTLKKFGIHPFIGASKLKILRLYEGIEYSCEISRYAALKNASDSPFWFDSSGYFNDLEFIEIYDKEDNLLRRYGLITEKEKGTDKLWIRWYHEYLFRSISGMELKENAHALPEQEQFFKSPLNFDYINDWPNFKDATTKNRFICGIFPELEKIDLKNRLIFLNYTWENLSDVYRMAQTHGFDNVLHKLEEFPLEYKTKKYAFDEYSEEDIKEKLEAICLFLSGSPSSFITYYEAYDRYFYMSGEEIVEYYNKYFKDFLQGNKLV